MELRPGLERETGEGYSKRETEEEGSEAGTDAREEG